MLIIAASLALTLWSLISQLTAKNKPHANMDIDSSYPNAGIHIIPFVDWDYAEGSDIQQTSSRSIPST
jgi:hypothetical protein